MSTQMHWMVLREPKTGLFYVSHSVDGLVLTHKRHLANGFTTTGAAPMEQIREIRFLFRVEMQVDG